MAPRLTSLATLLRPLAPRAVVRLPLRKGANAKGGTGSRIAGAACHACNRLAIGHWAHGRLGRPRDPGIQAAHARLREQCDREKVLAAFADLGVFDLVIELDAVATPCVRFRGAPVRHTAHRAARGARADDFYQDRPARRRPLQFLSGCLKSAAKAPRRISIWRFLREHLLL